MARTRSGVLRIASDHLRNGRIDEALDVIGEPDADCIAGRSIRLAALGLLSERHGDLAKAEDCFAEVHELGAPLPVVLRESGRYFKRTASFDRAYQCYSLAWQSQRELVREFVVGLPARELVRYAPFVIGADSSPYRVQPVREALAYELGAGAAAVAFAQMARYEPGFRLASVRIRDLDAYARTDAVEYEELAPARDVVLPPPPVYGRAIGDGLHARSRTFFFCQLDDIVVSYKSSFLLHGSDALFDAQGDEFERFALDLDVDPVVFGPRGREFTALVGRSGERGPALERGFPLTGVGTGNFGHWLLEYLPRVFACLDRPGFASVPLIIDEQMPRQHRQALDWFAGPNHPVVVLSPGESLRVKRLWTCSSIAYLPLGPRPGQDPADDVVTRPDALVVDPTALAALLAKVAPMSASREQRQGPSHVYMARRDNQHRRIVNRREVETWFSAHGFAIVDCSALDFSQQVALARGADVIVGPDGSSNFLTFFARPGTRVGVLTNAFAEDSEWYTALCRELHQPFMMLTGEVVRRDHDYRTFSDYRIDITQLQAFLDALYAESGG